MSRGSAVSSTPSPSSGSPLRRLRSLIPANPWTWQMERQQCAYDLIMGVPAALMAATLFGIGTPLAKLLLSSVSPWMLAGLFVSRLWLGSDVISSVHEVSSCPSTSSRVGMVHWRCHYWRRCWTSSAHGWIGRDTRIGCFTAVECRSCLHSPPRLVRLQREFRPTYRAWYDRNYGRSADIELAKRSPFRGVLVGLCDLGSVSCLGHRQQLDP